MSYNFGHVAWQHNFYLIYCVLIYNTFGIDVSRLPIFQWGACSDSDAFLTIHYKDTFGLPPCIAECKGWKMCNGVNYWRMTRICELLDSGESGQTYNQTCMFVSRDEMNETAEELARCRECTEPRFCDVKTGSCIAKVCPQMQVDNGRILGTERTVGSRAVVFCQKNFVISSGARFQSRTCQIGSWGDRMECSPVATFHQPAEPLTDHSGFDENETADQY